MAVSILMHMTAPCDTSKTSISLQSPSVMYLIYMVKVIIQVITIILKHFLGTTDPWYQKNVNYFSKKPLGDDAIIIRLKCAQLLFYRMFFTLSQITTTIKFESYGRESSWRSDVTWQMRWRANQIALWHWLRRANQNASCRKKVNKRKRKQNGGPGPAKFEKKDYF